LNAPAKVVVMTDEMLTEKEGDGDVDNARRGTMPRMIVKNFAGG